MSLRSPSRWLLSAWAVACAVLAAVPALAQVDGEDLPSPYRFELSEAVVLNLADSAVRSRLARVEAYLEDGQIDEALETLRRVMENSPQKLIAVTPWRYISVRDYCQLQLASLEPAALALYRDRVDSVAETWYRRGIEERDPRPLLRVVQQAFASSFGDDALLALGEMALEEGDYAAARYHWERILPVEPPPDVPCHWLGFPDTDLDAAAVRARLVLTSILEGSTARAEDELARFSRMHGEAHGRLGGRDTRYAEKLAALLAESATWREAEQDPNWSTFGGSPERNKIAPVSLDVGEVAWRVPLPVLPMPEPQSEEIPRRAVAEAPYEPLSFHPVVRGNLVLVNNQSQILAIDLKTGRWAWGGSSKEIYREAPEETEAMLALPSGTHGSPRFTLTVFGEKLFARMGASATGRPPSAAETGAETSLVCLDLRREGQLVWRITPEKEDTAFEGSPLCDGTSVYVATRQSEVHPQTAVVCLDAETGRRRWRTPIATAEMPARGTYHQCTHNLLTLHRDTLYYNTNLGTVAAVSTADGHVRWISRYERAGKVELLRMEPHWSRDLNPCLYDRGTLLAAPADSDRILALDAATGQILWQSESIVGDVVHLLGVANDHLIASGHRLYWISLRAEDAGRVRHVWPEGPEKLGFGRGTLAGSHVFWPTREKIYVFDQRTARLLREIPLVPRGLTGGNLVATPEGLLVATADELIALRGDGSPVGEPPERLIRGADEYRPLITDN